MGKLNLNVRELPIEDQKNINGRVLPLFAAATLIKGLGIGFGAVAFKLYAAAKDAA